MVLRPFRLAYFSAYFLLSAVSGIVVVTPPRLVVEYGAPASANCSTNDTVSSMGWEAPQGNVDRKERVSQLTWTVPRVTEWNLKPICYINIRGSMQFYNLPVTVYKTPEMVSSTLVNHRGPMAEEKHYMLQCFIEKVAPVRSVIVNWYKEWTLVKRDNETSKETANEPQNKISNLLISPSRSDDGAQYRCEAEIQLGADGPQPPPRVASPPLNITVHYMPQFRNSVEVLVDTGRVIVLDCTVKANPPAVYTWTPARGDENFHTSVITLSSPSPGNYTCIASNYCGNDTKVFSIEKQITRVVFWSILGSGLVLGLGLITGYVVFLKRGNSSNAVI